MNFSSLHQTLYLLSWYLIRTDWLSHPLFSKTLKNFCNISAGLASAVYSNGVFADSKFSILLGSQKGLLYRISVFIQDRLLRLSPSARFIKIILLMLLLYQNLAPGKAGNLLTAYNEAMGRRDPRLHRYRVPMTWLRYWTSPSGRDRAFHGSHRRWLPVREYNLSRPILTAMRGPRHRGERMGWLYASALFPRPVIQH